ncbi:hypothetical protein C1645_780592, partial [Glomus cerebriforme]
SHSIYTIYYPNSHSLWDLFARIILRNTTTLDIFAQKKKKIEDLIEMEVVLNVLQKVFFLV